MVVGHCGNRSCVRLTLFLLSAVAGCADGPGQQRVTVSEMVWPEPPAQARIALEAVIREPADVGIKPAFLQKLRRAVQGESDEHLERPINVMESDDGTIYVADLGKQGVHRFETARQRYRLIRREHDEPLPSPIGLAEGPEGAIYVTDSFLNGLFLLPAGENAVIRIELEGELNQPTGMAIDKGRRLIFVADTKSHTVKVFTLDGALARVIGGKGTRWGQFNYPTMVWLDVDGNLMVTDSLNFRVQTISQTGEFIRGFGAHGDGTGDFYRPKGVAADGSGHTYVIDAMFHAFQIFDEHGEFLLSVGHQGNAPGEFWLPSGIFINERNRIFVCDTYNGRIQVFRFMGGDA